MLISTHLNQWPHHFIIHHWAHDSSLALVPVFITAEVTSSSAFAEGPREALKVICNDFLVVKVNCWSYVFIIIKSI